MHTIIFYTILLYLMFQILYCYNKIIAIFKHHFKFDFDVAEADHRISEDSIQKRFNSRLK